MYIEYLLWFFTVFGKKKTSEIFVKVFPSWSPFLLFKKVFGQNFSPLHLNQVVDEAAYTPAAPGWARDWGLLSAKLPVQGHTWEWLEKAICSFWTCCCEDVNMELPTERMEGSRSERWRESGPLWYILSPRFSCPWPHPGLWVTWAIKYLSRVLTPGLFNTIFIDQCLWKAYYICGTKVWP